MNIRSHKGQDTTNLVVFKQDCKQGINACRLPAQNETQSSTCHSSSCFNELCPTLNQSEKQYVTVRKEHARSKEYFNAKPCRSQINGNDSFA